MNTDMTEADFDTGGFKGFRCTSILAVLATRSTAFVARVRCQPAYCCNIMEIGLDPADLSAFRPNPLGLLGSW